MKTNRKERTEKRTEKDITRTDNRTKEKNKSTTLFPKFQSNEREKKRQRRN